VFVGRLFKIIELVDNVLRFTPFTKKKKKMNKRQNKAIQKKFNKENSQPTKSNISQAIQQLYFSCQDLG
jgi:hypothetical protein